MSATGHTTAANTWQPPAWLDGLQKRVLWVGVGAIVLSAVGAFLSPRAFYRAYLVGFVFWVGIPLGCLGISMLQHMTGGGWGLVARRVFEAAARTLPLLALLFVPVALGMRQLYPWSQPDVVAHDAIIQHKQAYLNPTFFVARAALYFLAWWAFSGLLGRWSLQQDRTGNPNLHRRMQLWASVGLVVYMLTASFAGFDWLMSLDPVWFSSLYGMHFVVGQGAAALAFLILCARRLAQTPPMSEAFLPRHFDDYGKLLLAFVLLWVYMTFSQFLIIWSANLPEEITWYLDRNAGGFWWWSIALFALHFVLPFFFLMSRQVRRDPRKLAFVAVPVLVARWLDVHWQAAPSIADGKPLVHWLDLVVPVAIGGIWLAAFTWQLKRRALVPLHDPHLEEAIARG